MTKIVINVCYGRFEFSEEGQDRLTKLKGFKDTGPSSIWLKCHDIKRDDPILVKMIEEEGTDYNSHCSHLEVVEIPDDVEWVIEEYDGYENIAEKHRTWG